jgi:hypothetical protein
MTNPNPHRDTRRSAANLPNGKPGPFLARVVNPVDPDYMGKIRVQVLHQGNSGNLVDGELAWATYMSPFYGVTNVDYLGSNNTKKDAYDDTQKSYGMWVPTPDVGSMVIVMFLEGNANQGYWIGCVPEKYKNFMVPGLASTVLNIDYINESRVPVAEFNAKLNKQAGDLPTNAIKPVHPYIFKALKDQGLINDDIRGTTSTSARRESPSRVWGISTPGPVDKNGPVGKVGTIGETKNVAHSRLGGSTFVMDDGDEKFIRDGLPGDSPPLYNTVKPNIVPEGDVTIPHNELIRIRTRTGHQILLHNSEDLIYIGNARGTAWIELTSNGKIDIYSKDSISIHSANDLNITADRDITMEAGRNINMKAMNNFQQESGKNFKLVVTNDGFISSAGSFHIKSGTSNYFTAGTDTNIKSGGNHAETASKIYMNSSVAAVAATPATVLSTSILPDRDAPGGSRTSIMRRVPAREPWAHHENLDPVQFNPTNTDREATTAFKIPQYYQNYTTAEDTFKQGKK